MRGHGLGVFVHCAEFVKIKGFFVLPYPFLNKNWRTGIEKPNDVQNQHNGREEEKTKKREYKIEKSDHLWVMG